MKIIVRIILLIVIQISFIEAIKDIVRSRDDYFNVNKYILNETQNLTRVIRKSRQASANDPLNQGTDKLRNEITSFSESIKKDNNSPHPSSNGTNSNRKIANLESEIKNVKDELEQLKNAPNIDSSSKLKFTSLEVAIDTLQKLFDDKSRGSSSQMGVLESTIDSLTSSVSNYRRELEKLKKLMDEKDREESERLKPVEIVQDIKDREYTVAFDKLRNLPGDFRKNADHVVRAANINQGNNFVQMRNFAYSLHSDPEKCLKFYKALREEMESVHFNDVVEMLRLMKSVKNSIIRDELGDSVPASVKSEAEYLAESLQSSARDIAIRKFEDAMIADNYRSVSDLSNDITSEDPTSFHEIMKKVVNNVINRIGAEKLVNFMMEHTYISQRIYGYSAIFNELKNRNRLNDPAVVSLAFGLKNVMAMDNYVNTIDPGKAEEVKNALPKSVRIMAFSSSVCIRNRDLRENLHTEDYQSFDESRRRVATWIPGTRIYRDKWVIYPIGNVYFIRTNYLGGGEAEEHLYAADDNHKMDLSRRRVLTWIPGGRVKQGSWLIEPSGDDVYFKNYVHNEYLYADRITYKDDRTVYTWGGGNKPSNSLWTIEECVKHYSD